MLDDKKFKKFLAKNQSSLNMTHFTGIALFGSVMFFIKHKVFH